MSSSETSEKEPAVSRPSSSVILLSPRNEVLLLHRVESSRNFPSAHVFPGGNLDAFHDGPVPESKARERHDDGPAYRRAAIRETFEESGILLARNRLGDRRLVELDEKTRSAGRHKVHERTVPFQDWLHEKNAVADVDGLLPFTRWITPVQLPKRFTTQMYVYFLPLATERTNISGIGAPSTAEEAIIHQPTTDGGLEHTTARFLPASEWLRMQETGKIILFPPQVYLLQLLALPTFFGLVGSDVKIEELGRQRHRFKGFISDPYRKTRPGLKHFCICPEQIAKRESDGRTVLGLGKPGWELRHTTRRGDEERVILADFQKEGPRRVELGWRDEVLLEEKRWRQEHARRNRTSL